MNRAVLAGVVVGAWMAGCKTLDTPGTHYLQRVDADLRTAATHFIDGTMTGRDYLTLSIDRSGKARRFHDDAAWREAAMRGDEDADGVPDSYDQCRTPQLQPTDERGCPLAPRPACDAADPRCGPSAQSDQRTRELLQQVFFMINRNCDDSPRPQMSEPLQWGRGDQPQLNTAGFNMVVTQVDNQIAGCELFYEVEAFYVDPANPTPYVFGHALFKASEDFRPLDGRRAVFGLPANTALPPGRDSLRTVFEQAAAIQWRVRAVNGAQKTSAWSEYRVQGPASGGVPGRDL